MKPKKKVENAIRKKLRFTAAATLRDRWLTDVLNAQEEANGITPALYEPFIGRTIMRSPIVKLTSVAAVIAVAVLSITFWGKLSSPAYAIEQTFEALQKVRFLHVVGRDDTGQISDERWIEIGDDGYQVRYRQQNPPELVEKAPGAPTLVIEDNASVAVYRQDKKAVILHGKDHQHQWIGPLGQFFEDLREKGKILKENDEYEGRRAHKVWWPALNAECYVDPDTKLPIAIGNTQLSYEEPPAGTFEIVIPDGYVTLDKRPGAVAAAVPDWLLEDDKAQVNKEKCFGQGTRALIRGDYAEAAKQFEQALGYDTWATFWLGKAYYELGRYDLAIKNFDAIFDLFKKMGGGSDPIPFCQYARGVAYARLGALDKAQADLQACLPAMIQALQTPSNASMFEYADSPLIRNGQSQPGEGEIVPKMINRLRLVTGQNFGYDPAGTKEQKEAAIAAWAQWFKNGGQIQFTPNAPQLFIPAEWVNRLGWGRKSSQEIAARYNPAWLSQVTDPAALLKIGLALYDTARYEEALAMFEKVEVGADDSQNRKAMSLIWQGQMLDLLGRRTEAIARYQKAADMGLNTERGYAQYGLSYKLSPYAQERLATPFVRVENNSDD